MGPGESGAAAGGVGGGAAAVAPAARSWRGTKRKHVQHCIFMTEECACGTVVRTAGHEYCSKHRNSKQAKQEAARLRAAAEAPGRSSSSSSAGGAVSAESEAQDVKQDEEEDEEEGDEDEEGGRGVGTRQSVLALLPSRSRAGQQSLASTEAMAAESSFDDTL